jgi:thiol-disulfide isomerase/thioredoxin
MRKFRDIAFLCVLGLVVSGIGQPLRSQQPLAAPIDVKVIKYPDLTEFVQANKGKVILLDFWATTCLPCKASFFHTVELYKKYADKGLAVISVSTDTVDEAEFAKLKTRVLKFLRDQDATFTNVILDETPKLMDDKLRLKSIPCLYVFNREGQWTQFIGDDLKEDASHRHPVVEQYIKSLLDQPAKK